MAKSKLFAKAPKKAPAPKKLTTDQKVDALMRKVMGKMNQQAADVLEQALNEMG